MDAKLRKLITDAAVYGIDKLLKDSNKGIGTPKKHRGRVKRRRR